MRLFRITDKDNKTKNFRWWRVNDMCRMGRWLFWSWFDLNRSNFDEDVCEKNDFYIFVFIDLDLWSLDLKYASLVTLVQRYVSTMLEVSTAFLLRENRRHGTDGRTPGQDATLNAVHSEGRIISSSISLCVSVVRRLKGRKSRGTDDLLTSLDVKSATHHSVVLWMTSYCHRQPAASRRYCAAAPILKLDWT